MNTEDKVHHGHISKIDRYNWTAQDEPGDLRLLNKSILEVDYSYQRESKAEKLLVMARDWSWIACGAIVVAERSGRFYVIDGQHRVMASRRRSDITHLPCIVFQTLDSRQEAKGFLAAQTSRKAVTTVEKFKALVAVEDKAALLVKSLVEGSGKVIAYSSSPNSIKCVGTLLECARKDPETLCLLWPLIIEVFRHQQVQDRVVQGLMYIEKRMKEGSSLLDNEWSKRVLKVGASGLIEGAIKASSYYAAGGARVWASGMVEAINKGHRNLLVLDE